MPAFRTSVVHNTRNLVCQPQSKQRTLLNSEKQPPVSTRNLGIKRIVHHKSSCDRLVSLVRLSKPFEPTPTLMSVLHDALRFKSLARSREHLAHTVATLRITLSHNNYCLVRQNVLVILCPANGESMILLAIWSECGADEGHSVQGTQPGRTFLAAQNTFGDLVGRVLAKTSFDNCL